MTPDSIRRLLIYLLLLFPLALANAQTVQKGIVQEYNEKAKKTPLTGVELNVRSANSTVSDKDGNFTLRFLTLKPGEKVNVRRIEKLGYEVFNKEAIEQWNINPTTPFVIVMCRSDRFKKIRDNYEKVSSESYARQLKKEEAALLKLKEQGKLQEAEYQQQLLDLRENYEKQLDNLDSYIDRFSRIDLSELSDVEQQIIELVQQGEIDEAIRRYDNLNITENLKQEIQDRKEIREAMERLDDVKQSKDASIDRWYAMAERQIETLMLHGNSENNHKIADIYREIAAADTTNIDWLLKTGNYYSLYLADYEHALPYYQTALNNSIELFGEDNPTEATVHINLGVTKQDMGHYEEAKAHYEKALSIWINQYGPEYPDVALAYDSLGSLQFLLGEYENALSLFSKAISIYTDSYGLENPDVAESYNRIGYVFFSLGDYEKALDYYERSLSIQKGLSNQDNPAIATYYHNIGGVYSYMGDNATALDYYETALAIRERLYGGEHPEVAVSLNNIGGIWYRLGDYRKALDYFERALGICEKTYGFYHASVARSYNNLGILFSNMDNYDDALDCLDKSLHILEQTLGAINPDHPHIVSVKESIESIKQKKANTGIINCQ